MALQDAHENMGRFYYFFNLFVFFYFWVLQGSQLAFDTLMKYYFLLILCIGNVLGNTFPGFGGPNFRCFLNLFFF